MTTLNNQIDTWRNNTETSIQKIKRLLSQTPQEHTQDFLKLAHWIVANKDPYSFLPEGWQSARENAQDFEGFLNALFGAMVDDGELSFVKTKIHGSFMVFSQDEERIAKKMKKQFPHSSIEYTVHHDIDDFIEHCQEYQNRPVRSSPFERFAK